MKQFLNTFFVAMGVIFTISIIMGVYVYITDPWNIRPLFEGTPTTTPTPEPQTTDATRVSTTTTTVTTSNETTATAKPTGTTDSSFTLSNEQKQALVSFGIDPASVPSKISPEIEACFVANLGAPRVAEIKAGAVPGAIEFFKAKSCI